MQKRGKFLNCVILLLVISCNNTADPDNKVSQDSMSPVVIAEADEQKKNEQNSPDWLTALYERHAASSSGDTTARILFFHSLSGSASYCIYQVNGPNCMETFLATQKNREKFQEIKIGNECDADLSQPEYSYTNYEHDSVHQRIRIVEYTERAKENFLVKKGNRMEFREGYDLENVETVKDSVSKTFGVLATGSIVTGRNN